MKQPQTIYKILEDLKIAYQHYTHVPVFTVDEAEQVSGAIPGFHIKNLFLKDHKGAFALAVVGHDVRAQLTPLRHALGMGRFSFASPEDLFAHLGVLPGSVTPLGLMNAKHAPIKLVVDARIRSAEMVNMHPLRNDMTTGMAPADLEAFFSACGYTPVWYDFQENEAVG